MDREQLEALRRQVDEDYRLDLAAIERLQRRFLGVKNSATNSGPSNSAPPSSYSAPSKWSEEDESRFEPQSQVLPPAEPADRQREELVGSLRNMFNSGRPIGR